MRQLPETLSALNRPAVACSLFKARSAASLRNLVIIDNFVNYDDLWTAGKISQGNSREAQALPHASTATKRMQGED